MPATAARRARAGTRAGTAPGSPRVTRDQLVDVALALADRDGVATLTLRKLATALGVTPMALYWHVEDKDALLDALGERLFDEIDLPEPVDAWFDDVHAVCTAVVDSLRRHPAVAPLAVSAVMTGDAGVRVAERVLSGLSRAGLDDQVAADLGAYLLHALVVLVTALPEAVPPDQDDAQARRLRRKADRLAQLSLEQFPVVTRMADALTVCGDPDAFVSHGIDVLMLGVAGLVDRSR